MFGPWSAKFMIFIRLASCDHASRVICVVMRDYQPIDVIDSRGLRGVHDAIRVPPVEIIPAGIDQQRFALRINDQR